ncbi:glycosyltransferase family 4 protein [Zobellia laminariae]|uniref:glycosyltransferase family 4 protein n=1 Tax=Zobellia laminariae TaxID=248906 RepID=UPI0034CE62B0
MNENTLSYGQFPPESNAPATRTYEHCKTWVEQGVEVTVITGAPNFPHGKVYKGYSNKIYSIEYVDGIKVIRVWTFIAANKGFLKRIIDFISFMISAFIAGLFVKTDLIIATSPQFFTAVAGRWLAFWKRKKWVMEVRDLWPESIKAVGAMDRNIAIRFFEYLEHRMYKNAYKIVSVTDSFKRYIIADHNIPSSRIAVVKNGINTSMFSPITKSTSLIKELGLENKFIIGYIGTHGMAHKLDFILQCADKVKDESVHFLFVGAGAEKDNLLKLKENLGLKNVSLLPSVQKKQVKEYLSIIDVGLVNLRKSDTFKSVLPSKIFELAAMHKPILLGVEGEAKELVEQYNVGLSFDPENETEFLRAIERLKNSDLDRWEFSRLVADFDRVDLAKKMLEFLKED